MDSVHASMPLPKLRQVHDEQMYPEMVIIQKELYQYLAKIASHYGRGQAKIFGIMMPEMMYMQVFNELFRQPIHLGEYPNDILANASTQWGGKILIHHKVAKQMYNTYRAVIQCLHNQF